MFKDKINIANRRVWEDEVQKGCGYTTPWLDINFSILNKFCAGLLAFLPMPMTSIFPTKILKNVKGKKVLCLAAVGGQQSAIFGLLGD